MDRQQAVSDPAIAELEAVAPRRPSSRRRVLVATMCVIAVAGAGALVYSAGDDDVAAPSTHHVRKVVDHRRALRRPHIVRLGPGPSQTATMKLDAAALGHVLKAVQATAATGSFTVSYHLYTTAPAAGS